MVAHTIQLSITPICTACGKELRIGGLESKITGDPFERDSPSSRTDQRLYVYACQECFVYKGDLPE